MNEDKEMNCPKCGAKEELLHIFLNGIACQNCGHVIKENNITY